MHLGFQSGAAAALTADDLFRKVGAEMRKRAKDNQVAQQVAKELERAGVAEAAAATGPVQWCGSGITSRFKVRGN